MTAGSDPLRLTFTDALTYYLCCTYNHYCLQVVTMIYQPTPHHIIIIIITVHVPFSLTEVTPPEVDILKRGLHVGGCFGDGLGVSGIGLVVMATGVG